MGQAPQISISLSVHFLTLAALIRLLPPERRSDPAIAFAVLPSITSGILENFYIALQAARGRASHFNYDGALEIAIYGVILGLLVGPVLTLMIAGYMSQNGSHFAGPPEASAGRGIFLFGRSTEYGALRPTHLFALHMLQAAPLAGWLGDQISARLGSIAAFVTASTFGADLIAAFAISLTGQSPIWFLG